MMNFVKAIINNHSISFKTEQPNETKIGVKTELNIIFNLKFKIQF